MTKSAFTSSLKVNNVLCALKRSKKGDLQLPWGAKRDSEAAYAAAKRRVTLAGLKGRSFIFGVSIARFVLNRRIKKLARAETAEINALEALGTAIEHHAIGKIMSAQADVHAAGIAAAIEDYDLLLNSYMLVEGELEELQYFLEKNKSVTMSEEGRKFFQKFVGQFWEELQSQQKAINDLVAETENHAGWNIALKVANVVSTQTGGFLDAMAERRKMRKMFRDAGQLSKLEKRGMGTAEQLKAFETSLNESLNDAHSFVFHVLRNWRNQITVEKQDIEVLRKAKEAHEVPTAFEVAEEKHEGLMQDLLLAQLHSLLLCVNQVSAEAKKIKNLV